MDDREVGVGVRVDKAGGEDEPLRVDRALGAEVPQVAHAGDCVALDGHVRPEARTAGSISGFSSAGCGFSVGVSTV